MSVYKDMMMLEMESPREMYSDMMKTIKKSDEKKALQRLIDEKQMGNIFKVMLIKNKSNKFNLGF